MFAPKCQLYCLVLRHTGEHRITVGGKGSVHWEKEWLCYVGRSNWGWGSRVKRFVESGGSNHWHIDYFEDCPGASVHCVFPFALEPDAECELAEFIHGIESLEVPLDDLGASDCGPDCQGHLFVGPLDPEVVRSELGQQGIKPEGTVFFETDRCRWVSTDN
ncbi:MAG: DUF123 domain-containing protein [bacterium]